MNRTDFHTYKIPYTQDGLLDFKNWAYLKKEDTDGFQFEREFNPEPFFIFCQQNRPLIFGITLAYVAGVFGLQHFMKNRKALELKWTLIVWNSLIGIFSIVGFARAAPELIEIWMKKENPLYYSTCIPLYSKKAMFWTFAFVFSKLPEFADTFFLVLKKKPIIAEQWFHHAGIFCASWITAAYLEPNYRYVITLNFGVHGMLYPYFVLKLLRVPIPRKISNFITTCQLGQMVICGAVNLYSAIIYLRGVHFCHRHPIGIATGVVLSSALVYLFGFLFFRSVLGYKNNKKMD